MKNKLFLGILTLTLIGIYSCQKELMSENNATESSLSANLTAASASVTSLTVSDASTEDVQSVAVTKFDGTDPGAILQGPALPRDMYGHFIGFGKGMMHFSIPRMSGCATVTVSDSVFPKTITVDYGTGCNNGKRYIKRGKIIITISDSLIVSGAVKTVEYQDFYVDSNKVELTSTIKNLGKNSSGNWVIVSSSEQTITKPNGEYTKETLNDTLEWISGFDTKDKSDDAFYKSSFGTMVLNDTAVFSKVTTKPLLFDRRSCEFILSGTLELTRNGVVTTIDFGDGTCDSKATVTTNGTTEEIDIPSAKFKDGGKFGKHCPGFGNHGERKFGNKK